MDKSRHVRVIGNLHLIRRYLSWVFMSLLVFSGCIRINYDAEQAFEDNGNSVLRISEYAGIDRDVLADIGEIALTNSRNESDFVMLKLLADYYSSHEYAECICSMMGKEVTSCNPEGDGRVTLETKLTPGEFYAYDYRIDWFNLREIREYTIYQVPTVSYYAIKNNGYDEYRKGMNRDILRFFEDNADSYVKDEGSGDELKGRITEALESCTEYACRTGDMFSNVNSGDIEDYFLDFRGGTLFGMQMKKLGQMDGALVAGSGKIDTEVAYSATFQSRITCSTVGTMQIRHADYGVFLKLRDLENLPGKELVIVTENELSPLGVYTWIVLGIIGITLVSLMLFKK